MISLKNFDYLDLLENSLQDYDDLYDVILVVKNSQGEELGSVKAHKFLLSLLCPVFKKMFLGKYRGGSDSEDEKTVDNLPKVTIEAPCFEAFEKIIRFMYSGDDSLFTEIKELDMLFEIYRLCDQLLVFGIKWLVRRCIERISVSSANYDEVLRLCFKFKVLLNFEEMCLELALRCTVAVSSEWKTTEDKASFLEKEQDQEAKLLLIKMLKLLPAFICTSCGAPKGECLRGKAPIWGTAKAGMRVVALTNLTCLQGIGIPKDTIGEVATVYCEHTAIYCSYIGGNYTGVLVVRWPTTSYPAIHSSAAGIEIRCDGRK